MNSKKKTINSTVTTLHLDGNQIGNEVVIALGEALKINSTVTILDLGYNQIGNEGANAHKYGFADVDFGVFKIRKSLINMLKPKLGNVN